MIWNVNCWKESSGLFAPGNFLLVIREFSLRNPQHENLIAVRFFSDRLIHIAVNILSECPIGGNFAVDYRVVFVENTGNFKWPNFENLSFPRIHSHNSNRLYLLIIEIL